MDEVTILALVKQRLGITTDVRNEYLTARIKAVLEELTDEKGIVLEPTNMNHVLFVVDYVVWKYQSVDSAAGMPRYLQLALHNLMIHNGGGAS